MSAMNDATLAQIRAANPHMSTWLAANAGSGKTRVLTDRVARLLLTGVEPQHILCLTYTKAAASEMQNRLFKRLGEWAMLDADSLRAQLRDMGEEGLITPERLAHARTLFARAIETPGGLKIQTIHSFCGSLLRRFPLEAGVSPQFTEMEDRAAQLLRLEVLERINQDEPALLDGLSSYLDEMSLPSLLSAIVSRHDELLPHPGRDAIWKAFDLPAGFTTRDMLGRVFLGDEADLLAELIPYLDASGTNDQKAGTKLKGINGLNLNALSILEDVLLTGSGAKEPFTAKIGSFPTKAVQKGPAARLMDRLENLMRRVEDARGQRLALSAAQKALSLNDFAAEFLTRYAQAKQMRGALDFDDLIRKAGQLLTSAAVAQWVLYRLDGGIDHILVDEAQDTSPSQWRVIAALAQEFTSGEGARSDVERTIFVVGDKKQSIYSFQGADPRAFDAMMERFRHDLQTVDAPFQSMELQYSFRSSAAILDSVDHVFRENFAREVGQSATHRAFKSALPGRVDLWPFFEKTNDEDEDALWYDPVDRIGSSSPEIQLARQIAMEIRRMIDAGETIPDEVKGQTIRRKVRPGDFLILVQSRSALFSELIRACKAEELPIAGSDRLKVGGELAVRDLGALLAFLALPEDDLALATALRSPLFGWSEQQLFSLSHPRRQPRLWAALRDTPEHKATIDTLQDLRNHADFLRPFDLIERILTVHNGRFNLLSRLGPEAEDGINALLTQAMRYEAQDVPDLTGFLTWMQTDDLEIKRQIDAEGDEIRVMTVHGSKGLEAPIVILPDAAKRQAPKGNDILPVGDIHAWRQPSAERPAVMDASNAEIVGSQNDERFRLLYVAMTRAEKWLIVAGAKDKGKYPESWYSIVEKALQDQDTPEHDFGFGKGLRLTHGDWDGLPVQDIPRATKETVSLPAYATTQPPLPPVSVRARTASDLGGAKALPGDAGRDQDAAMDYGDMIHKLLEVLPTRPRAQWEGTAARLLAGKEPSVALMAQAEAIVVLEDPELTHLFAQDALQEVELTTSLNGQTLHCKIDCMVMKDGLIEVVDYKTNRTVPDAPEQTPEGLLRQMAAYQAALAQLYPTHKIVAKLLWTHTRTLTELPDTLLREALVRAGLA
ncbi:MAG: double-strand break repair helicase AddA [Pseudomonadota bacterium]|nr:double-strand break repair helicase AddA [Pseudomonadota bacterium]